MKLTSRSRGLGDTVEKITTVTGIKRVADSIAKAKKGTGECTPCQQRRDALNRLFPYQK